MRDGRDNQELRMEINMKTIEEIREKFPADGKCQIAVPQRVFKLVEKGRGGFYSQQQGIFRKVIRILGIDPGLVFRHIFESCSLVIAFNDKKTVLEICCSPQMIAHRIDTEHIFFR